MVTVWDEEKGLEKVLDSENEAERRLLDDNGCMYCVVQLAWACNMLFSVLCGFFQVAMGNRDECRNRSLLEVLDQVSSSCQEGCKLKRPDTIILS